MLRTHRRLEAYCATLVMKMKRKMITLLSFLQVMEHRWSETDGEKLKYSGNPVPVPLCPS
jgi:hypothetical protein